MLCYGVFIVDIHALFEEENKLHDVSCTQVYYHIGKRNNKLQSKTIFATLYNDGQMHIIFYKISSYHRN